MKPDDLKQKALMLLTRRDHSRRELTQKLQQRGFSAQNITPILDDLEQENLLNDDRFIANVIRFRRNRGIGPLKICAELQRHGFSRSQMISNEEWQEELWHAMAVSARIKRFGSSLPQTAAERAKQMRFLQQRGFTAEQVRYAILKIPRKF